MQLYGRFVATVCVAAALSSCGGTDASQDGAVADAASVEEVRALVEQFGRGGGDKDVAGERFYELAQRAVPALRQIIEDPATSTYDLESILFIVSLNVPDPQLFAALRARAETVTDPQERQLRLGLIEAMEAAPSLPYPR
jgi:hypothetical protein